MVDWTKVTEGQLFLACMQIAFTCEKCHKCCRGMDGIALNSIDIERMAKHMGMKKTDFIREYTVPSRIKPTDRWYKTVGEDARCPFSTDEGCSQYLGRGQVCRYYPFYANNCVTPMIKNKEFRIFDKCSGMMRSFYGAASQASAMDKKQASDILKHPVGKLAFLHMIVAEGKPKLAEKAAKELGFNSLPPEAEIRDMCWLYAVAMLAKLPENVLSELLVRTAGHV